MAGFVFHEPSSQVYCEMGSFNIQLNFAILVIILAN